ncbi:MAG: HAMP domain-containing histidine kinase, partial [Candidatus Obscuribacterales bacterium]|nr:HAMP domain-containing histidine kinase [Candidatus Obscuribacterales bacterium]
LEKIEAELARTEVEAENREMYQDRKRRHEFVRRINHDLNAPVSVLNWTISEMQMMNLENQQARDKVSRLVKSSDKLCELIDQLVQSYDYEITPGLANNQAALCDLTQVIDDCVDGQQQLAEKSGDTLEWNKPEGSLFVKANSLELSRVIDNIIRNAIKHNPPKTSVFVTVDSNGSFHKITISDSGKGIAAEHISHIFEPGYRVNPEKKDGHGLGLDIAKTLVEGMGGEISVSSTLGIGTTFQLKLPLCSEARAMHKDFISEEDILEATLDDSPALNARRKTLEMTAKQGTGER